MKKLITFIVTITLLFNRCFFSYPMNTFGELIKVNANEMNSEIKNQDFKNILPEFTGLDDPDLLRYVEDNLYTEVIQKLKNETYFIENVEAVYLSQEYIEELAYNSKENNYFGYSLSDLNEMFNDQRYVFTLGNTNETTVEKFEDYDDTFNKIVNNVSVGSGVILIFVTASMVTSGTPLVSLMFATGAKSALTLASSSAGLSGITTAALTGAQTNNLEKALKAGILSASDEFKWGAILGSITGASSVGYKFQKALTNLKGAKLSGLNIKEAAFLQVESGYPVELIKEIETIKEYEHYKKAGLIAKMIDGKLQMVQKIDLNYKAKGFNLTNLQLMEMGRAPIDPISKLPYELHHIGQKADGILAVLTKSQHRDDMSILHEIEKPSEINRQEFNNIRRNFWKKFAAALK
ncbi:HNH/ENDO VII family nuclease [Facklamia sp. P12950]|uniref:HNH/ENDO VII family nuclease n=1 Tax=Facklamia sp. P12950 TaxID=3421951 RepID=UPI003D17B615